MIVVLIVLLILFVLIVGPALLVWSINELLEQAGVANQIDWNLWSWLAAMALIMLLAGSSRGGKSR